MHVIQSSFSSSLLFISSSTSSALLARSSVSSAASFEEHVDDDSDEHGVSDVAHADELIDGSGSSACGAKLSAPLDASRSSCSGVSHSSMQSLVSWVRQHQVRLWVGRRTYRRPRSTARRTRHRLGGEPYDAG
jgi:hypothetical protein